MDNVVERQKRCYVVATGSSSAKSALSPERPRRSVLIGATCRMTHTCMLHGAVNGALFSFDGFELHI